MPAVGKAGSEEAPAGAVGAPQEEAEAAGEPHVRWRAFNLGQGPWAPAWHKKKFTAPALSLITNIH